MKKNRDISLDVLRVIAVLLVVSNHYFLHSGFFEIPLVGFDKIVMGVIRVISWTCVPLFLMLTGYLKNKKS